jgi:hypothetical protein
MDAEFSRDLRAPGDEIPRFNRVVAQIKEQIGRRGRACDGFGGRGVRARGRLEPAD